MRNNEFTKIWDTGRFWPSRSTLQPCPWPSGIQVVHSVAGRSPLDRRLARLKRPAHHGCILPVQKAHTEEISTQGPQITWELMVLEFKRVSPDDVRVSSVDL